MLEFVSRKEKEEEKIRLKKGNSLPWEGLTEDG